MFHGACISFIHYRHVRAISAAFIFLAAATPPAKADCPCEFAEPEWQAYGTGAGCTAYMMPGQKECRVAFGGTGIPPKLVESILGLENTQYGVTVADVLHAYLLMVAKRDQAGLTDPRFLEVALPLFMRPGYVNELAGDSSDKAKEIDTDVTNFVKENSVSISEVFLNKIDGFSASVRASKFVVDKKSISLFYDDRQVITTYMPDSL